MLKIFKQLFTPKEGSWEYQIEINIYIMRGKDLGNPAFLIKWDGAFLIVEHTGIKRQFEGLA